MQLWPLELSQEIGILGSSQMVTLWGCSLRLRRGACLPNGESHGRSASGTPQRMVTLILPTHPDLMVSIGPRVKLAWRRCRLRQNGKACHMVSHSGQTASWLPRDGAHSQGKLVYKANLTLPVLKWFQGKTGLSPEC